MSQLNRFVGKKTKVKFYGHKLRTDEHFTFKYDISEEIGKGMTREEATLVGRRIYKDMGKKHVVSVHPHHDDTFSLTISFSNYMTVSEADSKLHECIKSVKAYRKLLKPFLS